MDNMNLNKHISGQFNAELESVRNQVLVMGGLVEQQLTDAIAAIHDQDLDAARKIVANDHKVNAMEVAIDEECTRIIAKRQPTASDLRLVMAIIKTITDLERIGDVADKIARMLTDNANKPQPPLVSLENMGRRTIKMLHDVLDAFARMDLDAALAVYKEDDKVDREYESIIRELMTYMMEDPAPSPGAQRAVGGAGHRAGRRSPPAHLRVHRLLRERQGCAPHQGGQSGLPAGQGLAGSE